MTPPILVWLRRDLRLDDHPALDWALAQDAPLCLLYLHAPEDEAPWAPGAASRWNRGKDLSWEPLRAERVVEVAYDHLQGDRFRHATTFRRWRPDRSPAAQHSTNRRWFSMKMA